MLVPDYVAIGVLIFLVVWAVAGLAPAREAVTGARTHPVIKRTPTEVKAVAGKAAPVPSTDSRLRVLIAAPSRIK